MKRKMQIAGAVLIILAVLVSIWIFGYHNRKSNDNLPSLTAAVKMDEGELNGILSGYDIEQLIEVWGQPDNSSDNECMWNIDDNAVMVVNYNNSGKVAAGGLKNRSGEPAVKD